MDKVHQSEMKMVKMLRESTKSNNLVERAMTNGVDFNFAIEAVPGKVSLVNLLFKNPFSHDELFKVYIEDSEGHENSHELQLVNNEKGEWEYLVNTS